jgi:regulatory protein
VRIESIERDETLRVISIRTDGGEEFEIALTAEEARGMAPGLLLEPEQLEALRRAAQRKTIAKKVFGWLDRRRRTASWLRQRLHEEDHDADAIEVVVEDFTRQGLVNDREYARAWSADQVRRKPVGRRWLQTRLRREGVGDEDAWAGIDEVLSADEEREAAQRALQRKHLDLSEMKNRAKAMRFLQSRGFGPGLCRDAIDEARRESKDIADGGGDDAFEFDES